MIRPFRQAPTALLAALLLLAPLPFASVTLGWATVLRIGTFLVLCLALTTIGAHSRLARLRWPILCLVAVSVLGLLQTVHWPVWLIRILSPDHLALFEQAADLSGSAAQPSRPSMTLSVGDTQIAILSWLSAAAALTAAAFLGLERNARRILGAVLMLSAAGQVILGVPRWIQRATTTWGIEIPGDPARLRGTFVNADHLALFLELGLAVTAAWTWWCFRRAQRQQSLDRGFLTLLGPILVFIVLFTGLALTGSRAGLVGGVVALAGQGLVLALAGRKLRFLPIAVLALSAVLSTIVLLGTEQAFGRWLATSSYEVSSSQRRFVYAETLDLWARFPLFGSGLGSFQEAFPLVQSSRTSALSWSHAHNAPLELLATTGVLGFAIVVIGFVAVVLRLGSVHLRGYRSEDQAAALAAIGALTAVSFHEMFDFGATLPANTLTLAVIVGCGLAVRTRSSD